MWVSDPHGLRPPSFPPTRPPFARSALIPPPAPQVCLDKLYDYGSTDTRRTVRRYTDQSNGSAEVKTSRDVSH